MRPFEGAPFEKAVKPGLDGIARREHRSRIVFERLEGKRSSACSVDIDEAMQREYPNDHRWDYGIWYGAAKPKVVFVEAHKAKSGEVGLVLAKRRWLMDLPIGTKLPEQRWIWLATGQNKIPPQSAQMRRLHQARIRLEFKNIILN